MDTKLAIWAGLAALVALLLLWWRQSEGKGLALMASTPTSDAAAIAAMPPGTLVEVKGTLKCAAPLTAEFSQQTCAYFKAEIFERRDELRTNSDGKTETHQTSTPVHSNLQFAPCTVVDTSGTVALALNGATVEGEQVVDYVQAAPRGAVVQTVTMIAALAGGPSVEYRHSEQILRPDVPVYVLGEVQPGGAIGQPTKGSKNKTFIVSLKSEEQRSDDATFFRSLLLWTALGLFAICAGLIVWARMAAV